MNVAILSRFCPDHFRGTGQDAGWQINAPHFQTPTPGCKPGGFVVDFIGNPALFAVSASPLYPWITTNSKVYHRFCYKSATKKHRCNDVGLPRLRHSVDATDPRNAPAQGTCSPLVNRMDAYLVLIFVQIGNTPKTTQAIVMRTDAQEEKELRTSGDRPVQCRPGRRSNKSLE